MTKPTTVQAARRDQLTQALVRLAASRSRPRCGDLDTHHLWTSELEAERDQAVRLCSGCPLLQLCAEVGQPESFGVWGGVDRSPRKKTTGPAGRVPTTPSTSDGPQPTRSTR